jgi:hypothetical protein
LQRGAPSTDGRVDQPFRSRIDALAVVGDEKVLAQTAQTRDHEGGPGRGLVRGEAARSKAAAMGWIITCTAVTAKDP